MFPLSRRLVLAFAAVVAPAAVVGGKTDSRAAPCLPGTAKSVIIAATTDPHGRIRAWDYYANRAEPNRGLTREATIVDSLREANPGSVVLVDAGDILQGNPFAYVAAKIQKGGSNPIIAAMNAMHYDAAAIGNHEFNYGVPYLDSVVSQASFPFLAANVYKKDGSHAYRSSATIDRGGVRIAIVGGTTPGSDLWDSEHLRVAGLHVGDIVPAIAKEVAAVRPASAIVVVVLHSGLDGELSYDTSATGVAAENVALRVAREVPGIDVIVYGHTHKENAGQVVGRSLLIQPKNWTASVAVATIPLTCGGDGKWKSGTARGSLVQSAGHLESESILRVTERAHERTISYAISTIGSTPDTWSGDSSRVRDTPIIDFLLEVERKATGAQLASSAAFDTHAYLGPGAITVAQIAQLYPYENTLRAIRISGAQLRSYIDFSSRYYIVAPKGSLIADTAAQGYNFDIVSGVDYTLDVSKPFGRRVTRLLYHGKPVAPTDSFTMAMNNYRQAGGGGYVMLRGAPVVYDKQEEIRQLLIDEVRRRGTIRETDYFVQSWNFATSNQ